MYFVKNFPPVELSKKETHIHGVHSPCGFGASRGGERRHMPQVHTHGFHLAGEPS